MIQRRLPSSTVLKLASAFFISASLLVSTSVHAGPAFTTIKRSIEGAAIPGAKVLYWDQTLADDLGIVTARGHVGQADFEKSVTDQIAMIIKAKPEIIDGSQSTKGGGAVEGTRYVEIEVDAHGGSGRAGYIKLVGKDGKDVWINIKGIGLTGVGNAKSKPAGPPLEVYGDHSDGSADLPEGIVETINAKVASNDLKYGAGRILSLITINKQITFENGLKYPLVLIVRAPMRRMDRELAGPHDDVKTMARIADSLGQANAMRIFKGDLVNQSNIGAGGEFVDFGLFSVVNGYVPAFNYLKVTTLKETDYLFKDREDVKDAYHYSIGFHLLSQLGFDESRIQASPLDQATQALRHKEMVALTNEFIKLIYKENKPVDAENSGREKAELLAGNFQAHRLFKTIGFDILSGRGTRDELIHSLYVSALQQNKKPSRDFEKNFKEFAATLVDLVQGMTADLRGDKEYAAKIRKIAAFKNRDIDLLDKRNLREWSVEVMEKYVATKDPSVVQTAIEGIVNQSKLSTGDFTTAQMRVTADDKATYLDVKAFVGDRGEHGLFSYPEIDLLSANAPREFRVSSDGRKTYTTFDSSLIETPLGLFYRIAIPHGALPLTPKMTSVVPVGTVTGLTPPVEMTAPPLLLNERFGLPKDFARVTSLMRSRYGVNIDPVDADLNVTRVVLAARAAVNTCSALFGM